MGDKAQIYSIKIKKIDHCLPADPVTILDASAK
jgi:hypothetical protein